MFFVIKAKFKHNGVLKIKTGNFANTLYLQNKISSPPTT